MDCFGNGRVRRGFGSRALFDKNQSAGRRGEGAEGAACEHHPDDFGALGVLIGFISDTRPNKTADTKSKDDQENLAAGAKKARHGVEQNDYGGDSVAHLCGVKKDGAAPVLHLP